MMSQDQVLLLKLDGVAQFSVILLCISNAMTVMDRPNTSFNSRVILCSSQFCHLCTWIIQLSLIVRPQLLKDSVLNIRLGQVSHLQRSNKSLHIIYTPIIRYIIHYTHLEGSYHKSQKLNSFPSQLMRNIYIIFVNTGDIPYRKATGHPAICEPVTSDYCKSKNWWIPSCEVSEATTHTPISERPPTTTTTTTTTHSFKTQPTKATNTGIIYSHLQIHFQLDFCMNSR